MNLTVKRGILFIGCAAFLSAAGSESPIQNNKPEIDWARCNSLQSLEEKYRYLADSYKAICVDIEQGQRTAILGSPAQDQTEGSREDDELISALNPYLFQRWAEEHHSPTLSEIFTGKPPAGRILKRMAPSLIWENLEAKAFFDRFLSSFISWKTYEKLRRDALDLKLIFHESFDNGKLERWTTNTFTDSLFFDSEDKIKGDYSLRIKTGEISGYHYLSTGTLNHSPTILRISWFSKAWIRQTDTARNSIGLTIFGMSFLMKRNGPDLRLMIPLAEMKSHIISLSQNEWHAYQLIYNETTKTFTLFLDGELVLEDAHLQITPEFYAHNKDINLVFNNLQELDFRIDELRVEDIQ